MHVSKVNIAVIHKVCITALICFLPSYHSSTIVGTSVRRDKRKTHFILNFYALCFSLCLVTDFLSINLRMDDNAISQYVMYFPILTS